MWNDSRAARDRRELDRLREDEERVRQDGDARLDRVPLRVGGARGVEGLGHGLVLLAFCMFCYSGRPFACRSHKKRSRRCVREREPLDVSGTRGRVNLFLPFSLACAKGAKQSA